MKSTSTTTPLLQALSFVLALAYHTSIQALEEITLQLKSPHAFEFAGYYAAQELGYYRDAGLNVSFKEGFPGVSPSDVVTAGNADYAVGTSNLLLERKAGKPVVVLAVIFQHSPFVLIAQQTHSIHDIVDKRIEIETPAAELLAYLKNEGIPTNNIQFNGESIGTQELLAGKAQAISGEISNTPYYLDRANFNYQLYSPRAAGIDFYGDNLFTSEQEIKNHPERVRAFLTASLKGWQYAMENQEELTSLILSKYSKRHPRQFYLYEAKEMMKLMHPELIEIGHMNPGRWKHIAETYAQIGLLPENYPIDDFLYNPFFKFNKNTLYRGGAILLFLLTLLGSITYYISFIKRKLARSIKNEQLSELREYSRNNVLELLANDAPLHAILDDIVRSIEQSNPGMLCSISLLDAQANHLVTGSAPNLPEFYNRAMNGLEIGLGVASGGTAAFTGQRVIVEDIQNHPYWTQFKELTYTADLGSCWSEPIFSTSGKILGTLDIYHSQSCKPTDADLHLLGTSASIAAIALDRNRSNQVLKEKEKLLSDILENVSAFIYMKDRKGRYLFANRQLRELFNAPMEEIIGFDDCKFYDADTAKNMRLSDLKVLNDGETLRSEDTNPNPLTGQTSIYLTVKLPLRHEDGSIYALCGISTDITEQKEIEEYMRHMAQYDALTGLPNRALFSDRLQQNFSNAKRTRDFFGLMFIDLDKFKPINDNYGHATGDILLKDASLRMQGCVRESDTVARIGGDEFVILLASIKDEQDALDVAEKIRHALNLPFKVLGHTLNISSSIGVAIYPEHGDNEKELTKNADLAMYYAKENGRNNVTIFNEGLKNFK